MNALQNNPDAALAHVAPMLDEAITHLSAEDRSAILLRFFEQCDFRAIGAALGTSDDAAQKRVTRALQKLELLLKRRGVTFSAAVLATCLGSEALTAAPAGLAAIVAGNSLAAAATGGTALSLLKIMTMTKLKVAAIAAVVAAGVATPMVIQQHSQTRLRAENESLRQQVDQLSQAANDNKVTSESSGQRTDLLSPAQLHELLRLRGEVGALRTQMKELERLKAENARLQASRMNAKSNSDPQSRPSGESDEKAIATAKISDAKMFVLGLLMHANDHPGSAATNLDEIDSYLDKTKLSLTNKFEMLYQGSFSQISNPGEVIVIREQQARQGADGTWLRAYGFADGHSQLRRAADGNFDDWEKEHTFTPPTAGQ